METEPHHPDPDTNPETNTEAIAEPRTATPPDADGKEHRTRILNAPIPEPIYWRLRDNALASRLSFRAYLAKYLAESKAYPPKAT